MPLKIVKPGARVTVKRGKRYANAVYLARGSVAGRAIEESLQTTDLREAKIRCAALELSLLEEARIAGGSLNPALRRVGTFAEAAERYMVYRHLADDHADRQRLERIIERIGKVRLVDITVATLHDCARKVSKLGAAAATLNRETLRPCAAVLHFMHDTDPKSCPNYIKVKLFKEPRARVRAVTQDTAATLIGALDASATPNPRFGEAWYAARWGEGADERIEKRKLLIVWLFRTGMRITEALRVRQENIDLDAGVVAYEVTKTDQARVIPLHEDLVELLRAGPALTTGPLFPWASRWSVYNWLRPVCAKLGLKFTPHMARHSMGKWLNESGASLRTIMDTLGHADIKSSARYQSTDIEVVRASGAKLGSLLTPPTSNGK